MRRRGFTLLELLIATSMTAVILVAGMFAYSVAIDTDARIREGRDAGRASRQFEQRVSDLLRAAYVSDVNDDTTTFFIASAGAVGGDATASNADTITFTTAGERVSSSALEDDDDDFQARNERYGPLGGVAEVAIETSPVGSPTGGNDGGVFLRVQRPNDGDPSQGGYENVLDPEISSISYEFWDGTEWITEWDTRSNQARRLPASVRITYSREGDEQDHVFTVKIIGSDVTEDKPITAGAE
ncbi:prepilin-type N-terminal cleavage/methylation domain-containing protein [bacterium]|nr:MAG: prepilin-type N-terminal cleavage/methylation domain-containing protein [bacterium]